MIQSYIMLILSVTIASVSQILLKYGADKDYKSIISQYINPFVITGYALTFISLLLTVFAYRGLEYKIGPLIESLGYILVMIFGRIFFKEKITTKKIIGITLIFIGIFVYHL